jgi:hypothetical protein
MKKDLSWNTKSTKTIILDTRRMLWNAMDEMKNCRGYANSYENCYKYGKFSLVDIPLRNAWKLSKTMHPALPHSPREFQDLI